MPSRLGWAPARHQRSGEDHEAGMDHHPRPCPVPLRRNVDRNFDRAPADPPITKPAGNGDCGSSLPIRPEQKTAQDPLLMIPDDVLHRTTERVPGAQIMMVVHRRVPDRRLSGPYRDGPPAAAGSAEGCPETPRDAVIALFGRARPRSTASRPGPNPERLPTRPGAEVGADLTGGPRGTSGGHRDCVPGGLQRHASPVGCGGYRPCRRGSAGSGRSTVTNRKP